MDADGRADSNEGDSNAARPGDPDHPHSGVWCIVVAGGSGQRFGSLKQLQELDDARVVDHAVAAAATAAEGVVLVVPSGSFDEFGFPFGAHAVVSGGRTRAASVREGLRHVPREASVVLVHDAARPLASPELFARVRDAVLAGAEAVVPVVPVVDTIRRVGGGVVDRDELRAVQTPQGFRAETLRLVHVSQPEATDDAGLVEAAGGKVVLVEGERTNLKITEPADLAVARALVALVAPGGGDSTT